MTTRHPATDHRRPASEAALRRWLLLAVPVVAIAVAVAATVVAERTDQPTAGGTPAPPFTLPATTGETIALDDVLAEGDALVYFSMGVGCDGCFVQIPEVHHALAERGIELVSIMVGPPDALVDEAARFGIDEPILVDADRSVSAAYGMLGQFGHGNVPSHSFAYVSSDGTLEAVLHYPVMFVPLEQLLADLDLA